MKRDHVRRGHELVEGRQLDTRDVRVAEEWVVRENSHLERAGAARDLPSDPPQPDDSEHRTGDPSRRGGGLIPSARAYRTIEDRDPPQQIESEGDRVVGDLVIAVTRSMRPPHPCGGKRLEIQVVIAGGGGRDDAQIRKRLALQSAHRNLGWNEQGNDACATRGRIGALHADVREFTEGLRHGLDATGGVEQDHPPSAHRASATRLDFIVPAPRG